MNETITNLVRSAIFLGCALPLTIALTSRVNVGTEVTRKSLDVSAGDAALIELKDKLTDSCIRYVVGKVDGAVERKAQTEIDDHFDGEVYYKAICDIILK